MGKRVVILGGGVGGLGAAIGLARRGHAVTVIERDPPPETHDLDAAFVEWERRSVPQSRQPHAFSARTRNLLLEYAPDVVDRLVSGGVREFNIADLIPEPMREEGDAIFTGLMVRRLPFELALREAAEAEDSIDIRCPAVATGLMFAEGNGAASAAPVVTGVRLEDGTHLAADIVIDAGGRKTPVLRWLGERGVTVAEDVQDCNMIYNGRYYRLREGSPLDRDNLFRLGGDLGYMVFSGFPGDHGSIAIFFGVPPWDEALRPLRHNHVWEAAARSIPALAPYLDPSEATPLMDVGFMAGHQNTLRHYVAQGEPVVLGLLPVGDSLCTTNPNYGWGASLALTYAFAAVDAVDEHGDDLRKCALAYHGEVDGEAAAHWRASADDDRIRTYFWKGEEVPEADREVAERVQLIQEGLQPGMRRDLRVLRAMMRRQSLIDPPDAIWEDEEVIQAGREIQAWREKNKKRETLGPTRDELLSIIEAAVAEGAPVPA